MSFGLRLWDSNSNLVFDSDALAGGMVVDVRTYASGESATLTYPSLAGLNVMVVPLIAYYFAQFNVTSDTSLGYPRVTVSPGTSTRTFLVVVW